MKKLILFLLCIISLSVNAANKRYALKGKLGKSISFRLDIEEDTYHGILIGQTTYYRKNGNVAKIKAYGIQHKQDDTNPNYRILTLSEFDGTRICGNIVVTLNADGSFSEGVWYFDGREYDMNNIKMLPENECPTLFNPVDIEKASGVYRFFCPAGKMSVREYGGTFQMYYYRNNVAYSACQVTPNIAETKGKMAEIFANQFYFYVDNASYDVFAFEDAVIVKRTNPQVGPVESFGAYVDVEGIYMKTNLKLYDEVLTVFDEEKEFSANLPFTVFDLNDKWMEVLGGETTFPDEIITKDIDGDGKDEVIARYTENKTDGYEVRGNRSVIFVVEGGNLVEVASAEGDREDLEIADGYIIKNTKDSSSSRITHNYFHLRNSLIDTQSTATEAENDNLIVGGETVKEQDFKEQMKIKECLKLRDLNGWKEVPGNIRRNETAARG